MRVLQKGAVSVDTDTLIGEVRRLANELASGDAVLQRRQPGELSCEEMLRALAAALREAEKERARYRDEIARLGWLVASAKEARLAASEHNRKLREAIQACIGDAEGQEAVRDNKMLELTRGQVQLLAAALAVFPPAPEEAS